MVAAQWGEGRDTGARTGGGVAGRFRTLGSAGEAPDTTPPPFGTAPWGYRRSEVDAWASWMAGLVAHGRNETVRADSAEATLRATLERLEQLERPERAEQAAEPRPVDRHEPQPAPEPVAEHDTAVPADASVSDGTGGHEPAATPDPRSAPSRTQPVGTRAAGRLHFAAPADLPRRTGRGPVDTPTSTGPRTAGTPDTIARAAAGAPESNGPGTPDAPGGAARHPAGAGPATPYPTTPSATAAPDDRAPDPRPAPGHGAPQDPRLARLHVVETTLHEVLGLLHHLADQDRPTTGT